MDKPIKKIGSALIDQGAFALANFLINIQLARLLSPNEYGLFALAFTTFTLVNIALTSFLVEPMMVNGSGAYSKCLKPYLRYLVKDFWKVFTPVCSIVILVIGALYRDQQIFVLIAVLALGVGPLCFQFFVRRTCYLYRQPWIAATGGLTYLSLIVIFTSLGSHLGYLSSLTGLGLMVLSAVFGSLVMMSLLKLTNETSTADAPQTLEKEAKRKHMNYGRWAVLTSALAWIPGNIYILLLPIFWSYEEAGLLRASLNLILPVLQIQMAMTPLLLPWLVRQIDNPDFSGNLRKVAIALILLPTFWTLGLGIFGQQLLEFAYDGKYQTSNMTLALLGGTTMVSALVLVLSASIKAHSQPKLLVRGYCLATLLCLFVGIPLMVWYGILGVVIGMFLAAIVNLVTLFIQFNNLVNLRKTCCEVYAS